MDTPDIIFPIMKKHYHYQHIPSSRIATFDICSIGVLKHHVSALLEFDVTDSRIKLKALKRNGDRVSFTGWLIKVISKALTQHPEVSAYWCNKRKIILFDDINISILVEKKIGDQRVPLPMVIEKTNEKSVAEITLEIENAQHQSLSKDEMVLNKPPKLYERLYYMLPGFIRRVAWRYILSHPKVAYRNMGNAVITSLGMMGRINGWFIPKSIHPVSFGTGSIIKKPRVVNNEIKIREILNVTVLFDHDVVDGAPMVRFLNDLTTYVEQGSEL